MRSALALVFLYFSISQLIFPESFAGWLPKEASLIPISPTRLVILNGGFELFFGVMLMLGIFRRLSALLLGLHLAAITFSIGFTEIGIRDFGLAVSTLSIALIKEDVFSLEYLLHKFYGASGESKKKDRE